MPVFKQCDCSHMPDWSLLRCVKKYYVHTGETLTIDTGYEKAGIFVVAGFLKVSAAGKDYELLAERTPQDSVLLETGEFTVTTYSRSGFWMDGCEFYVFSGNWPGWVMFGNFHVEPAESPVNPGDPVEYDFNTNFDNHYHDYDEYWLVIRGSGVVQSEGILYRVETGDLIATKRGDHHHFAGADQRVKCIGFKSRLGGPCRLGYLWEHKHGKPCAD